tara:strand:- start:3735 stop:3938 length:204 start_codon:yes stop_codon:yes gene_type:complete
MNMPQADWYAGHAALLVAMGIQDNAPVTSEQQALAIARRAADALAASVAQAAGKSGSSGNNTRRKRK